MLTLRATQTSTRVSLSSLSSVATKTCAESVRPLRASATCSPARCAVLCLSVGAKLIVQSLQPAALLMDLMGLLAPELRLMGIDVALRAGEGISGAFGILDQHRFFPMAGTGLSIYLPNWAFAQGLWNRCIYWSFFGDSHSARRLQAD